jgi:hypothetical protein
LTPKNQQSTSSATTEMHQAKECHLNAAEPKTLLYQVVQVYERLCMGAAHRHAGQHAECNGKVLKESKKTSVIGTIQQHN